MLYFILKNVFFKVIRHNENSGISRFLHLLKTIGTIENKMILWSVEVCACVIDVLDSFNFGELK